MSSAIQSATRPHLLLIHAGHAGGRTHAMVEAVKQGITDAGEAVELRVLPALQAGVEDLLWANGLLISRMADVATPCGACQGIESRRERGIPRML